MLTADGAAVFLHQERRLAGNVTEELPSLRRLQVDDGAQMQFARTDMAVVDDVGTEACSHFAEVFQIFWQSLRGHRRIFNNTMRLGVALHAVENAQPCFAQSPDTLHIIAVCPCAAIDEAALYQMFFQFFRLSL